MSQNVAASLLLIKDRAPQPKLVVTLKAVDWNASRIWKRISFGNGAPPYPPPPPKPAPAWGTQ